MREAAETSDLVLVLGTSLGGLNADQVAHNSANRSLQPSGSLGTVIINLQQTEQDGKASLRLFGKTDDLLGRVLEELGYDNMHVTLPVWPSQSRVLVPYDARGRLSKKTVLYTGAGISAAVVGQAARGSAAAGSGDSLRAKPTFTHIALGFLGKEGMIHDWVQQNHDGLPQKAGFPQEKINEIHGEHVYAHVYTCLHTCLYTCLYTYLYTCL